MVCAVFHLLGNVGRLELLMDNAAVGIVALLLSYEHPSPLLRMRIVPVHAFDIFVGDRCSQRSMHAWELSTQATHGSTAARQKKEAIVAPEDGALFSTAQDPPGNSARSARAEPVSEGAAVPDFRQDATEVNDWADEWAKNGPMKRQISDT